MVVYSECPVCRKRQIRREEIKDNLKLAGYGSVMYVFFYLVCKYIFGGMFWT